MSAAAHAPDWRDLDLAPGGRSLIEASAGTGKTWTIAALYLRLLLENALTPRRIVVTTFTDAAASELRERLRARLAWAEAEALGFDGSAASSAEAIDTGWLRGRWRAEPARRETDLRRLRLALAELDLAPISTLHGLCARILAEHPFAAGGRFVQGELVDGAAWHAEIAADLRRVLAQGDPAEVSVWLPTELRACLPKPPSARQIGQCLAPGSEVPEIELPPWPAEQLVTAFREGAAGLKGNYKAVIRGWRQLADFIENHGETTLGSAEAEALAKVDYDKAVSAVGRGLAATARALAGVDETVAFAARFADARRQRLWQSIRGWAIRQKARQSERHDQRSFDDLLTQVRAALRDESAQAARPLADALFAAWPVAMVDEFQDTDGVQYGILDAIYRDAEGMPRGRLVMIGDPKQAIYRFRGGDIHSYQRAAASAAERDHLRLAVNHRSSRAMVAALNAFFAHAGEALDAGGDASSGIAYRAVEASARRDAAPYTINGTPLAQPLRVLIDPEPPEESAERVERALSAAANDIAAMLASGTHFIGKAPLRPADIAVLLPTHAQILRMKALLEARGVPSVAMAKSSVLATGIARELQLVLYAVLHAERQPPIRAALATRLGGMTLAAIRALDADAAAWQSISLRFHGWRRLWQTRGVQALVDALIGQAGARLLAGEDGERALTDLRHLGEALQAEAEAGLGPRELLDWMAAARVGDTDGEESASESRQLRIESEAPRVRLMTLHASKGLEFPVVFLPLMWAHGERREDGLVVLHDPATGTRQLRADAAAAAQAARELQDERFRMLYVALTRAIYACHIHALPPQRALDARKGASSVSDAGTRRSALDVLLARLQPALDSVELAAATPHVDWRQGWNLGEIAHYRPALAETARGEARAMPETARGALPSRYSFSTLTRGLHAGDGSQEAAAGDEAVVSPGETTPGEETAENEHPELLALQGVRGIGIGNAMHAVFEHRVVGQPVTGQGALLRQALQAESLWPDDARGGELAARLGRRIDAVLAAPLAADLPALGALPANDLLAEMEFHFALDATSMSVLRDACAAHGEPLLVPPNERPLAGLMTGKIDLLFRYQGRFHVLDYKGNFLGARVGDYAGDALGRAMDAAHYRFQALLYVLALDRHLRQRLPDYSRERHLGEVCYLFVRAAGLAPGAGVWRHRFGERLLDAAQVALPGHDAEAAA
ncbi:hypothetical protein EBB59_12710 [Lysobacter pythonis]|uniref:RecBCD enzyme subunit RecB n=1 Tax=Solilutibacter pythonis TaxID=2483112 RepID=A0A3M2HD48_9GAMM|nr:UvrD-helicase domain-containing protein [Lysobacter pythonis]RMH87621.1 hypothetical protein EBB59_12710 [Lysobacter pythonis]